jgi:small subunit ribosomal protein S16
MRMGKTKSPYYRVVVMDGRAPRDGRYIDLIGHYDPRQEPSLIEIDKEKAVDWLRKGAQPTEAAAKLLEVSGALTEFKVKAGKIHTVGAQKEEPAPAEEAAEAAEAAAEEPPAEEEAAGEETAEEAAAEEAAEQAEEAAGDGAAESEES